MTDTPLSAPPADTRGIVAQNLLYLTLAQVLGMPLSILFNAMMSRYLGPDYFGHLYFATTIAMFGFLVVDWGHQGALPAAVATERSRAAQFLGSSLLWRSVSSVVVYAVLAVACRLRGYPSEIQWVLALVCATRMICSITNAYQEVVRGFERTEIAALGQFASRVADLIVVAPVLLLGGKLRAALVADAVGVLLVLALVVRAAKTVGVGAVSLDKQAFVSLFRAGAPFVICGVAMVLQPSVDVYYLSQNSAAEVMGWYAVSRQVIGVLLFPASALIGALYPTLCRLQATDHSAFVRTEAGAIEAVSLFALPVAAGCFLFPDIGVWAFGHTDYRPAEDNLRISALHVLLVYLTMLLGISLMAAGRQRVWALVQSLCVVVSLTLNPILVPYFERHARNGGLGVCVAGTISEVLMVGVGIALSPKGILSWRLGRTLALAALCTAAMVVVARLGRALPSLPLAVLSVAVYGAGLWLTGAVAKEHRLAFGSFLARKLTRFRAWQ